MEEENKMAQSNDLSDLIDELSKDMLGLYDRSKKEIGYISPRFISMLAKYGPLVTAQKLIHKYGGTDGFATLWEHNRLDLSVEALALNHKYSQLFTTEELQICRNRLAEFGYIVDESDETKNVTEDRANNEIIYETDSLLDYEKLRETLDRFVEFVHDQDENELPLDFVGRNGFLKCEENYKSLDVVKAREILEIDSWDESMIGTGVIGARAKKAISKCFNLVDSHSITKLSNMVNSSYNQYSVDSEKAIFKIYKSDNEKAAFEFAKSVFGGIYDLLACLFFIKDENRFLPIRSDNFDKRFAQLGIDFRTSAKCSWENYSQYIRIINCIRNEMNRHICLEQAARLLDAHSFVWIIGGKKYSEWIPNKEKCFKEVISIEKELEEKKLSGGEERAALVKVRINQGAYRKELLKRYHSCALCGMGVDKALIASHIKPWSKCTKEEKTDIDNGFILCPNHDKLFDIGLISFDDEGHIIISKQISESDCDLLCISPENHIRLKEGNKKYLRFHRELFKKNLS